MTDPPTETVSLDLSKHVVSIYSLTRLTPAKYGQYSAMQGITGVVQSRTDGREFFVSCGRLCNSTKFAAQISGLEQCSPTTPAGDKKFKRRP